MFLSKAQILAILAFTGSVVASPIAAGPKPKQASYKGCRVVRVPVHTSKEAKLLKGAIDNLGLDTWTHTFAPNHNIDVVLTPATRKKFEKVIKDAGLEEQVMHEDLDAAIQQESTPAAPSADRSYASNEVVPGWFDNYHPLWEHVDYLHKLVAAYPGHSEIVVSGMSTQGREIFGIHIWGNQKGKEAVVLHGTVHAREWITAKVTEFFAEHLLMGTSNNATAAATVNKYDYYIFPVVNPDGFTHSQTTDRMWRKNRLVDNNSGCIGTDVNRNWDYKWSNSGGASTNPCDQDFKGLSAGNTAEYQGLSSFIQNLVQTVGVKAYIDYHSYSQLILSPWGYTCTQNAPDAALHMSTMQVWEAASRQRYGTTWTIGPACQTIYPTTGDSTDWTYGAMNITHSYTVELRDTGNFGFLLPADQIIPSGEEAFDGFKAMINVL